MSFVSTKGLVFGIVELPVAADAVIDPGVVVVSTAGYAKPGSKATGQKVWGIALDYKDNTGGADGALTVRVQTSYPKSGGRELFWLANDATTPLAQADVGTNPAYLIGPAKVSKDSTGASKAGTVMAYDAAKNLVGVLFDQ